MHILLTDLLTCPRCGPDFGLILLADRLEERQVVEGRLGCPNCRESFEVHAGVADLRHRNVPGLELGDAARGDELALRTAALLGVRTANSAILVIERHGAVAGSISEMLPAVHLLGLSVDEPATGGQERGLISRVRAGVRLPVRGGALRGVAALGVKVDPLLDDIHRVLAPGSRLVVDPSPSGTADALVAKGFTVLLEQDGVTVAALPGPG